MAKPSYIPSLDGLRAVSIALVFLSHVGFGHVVPGGFGVTIFFFLSGYLITTLMTREWDQHGSIAMRAFYLRRIVRLSPPILFVLLVSALLVWAGWAEGRLDIRTISSQIFFYYNYFSLYAPDPATVNGLGILWSLAVEEHFYLIWPTLFILLVNTRFEIRYLLVLLMAVVVWRAIRVFGLGTDEWTIYISTDTRLDSLLYGCLLAMLTWRGHADRLFGPSLPVRMVWLGGAVVVLLVCLSIRDETFRAIPRYSLQGLALMPIFHYAVTQPSDPWFRPLNWAPLRKIGQWSFTIYLIHYVIIEALIYSGFAALGDWTLVVTSAALSAAFAAATYRWLEKPFHPLRRRLTGH
jgi:peptidoglycan/LPS O-acetylase OafA/YrhL